ncbi:MULTISPECIES: hypothetical protein [Companilactobacillus]|uniref:Uncharacterized protein n=1 Tax=Companilactobacillus nodensis DSM 19682 = JCM 14932 = NBRC 107160 TaxID=1423775 RepID=A0A0R1K5B1_9LACO|nr:MULTISPECIES: hypothetical protein [Companilactobacillus]KRK78765.1 hypothetical protein FD03_GL002543 [Companilactobacillus nodensis DSM 19682 = JCM 14932 = NBRC 107160]
MIKNTVEYFTKLKHLLLINLDTVLFLIALILLDVNSYHFGSLVGNYVVVATLLLVVFVMNKPK